MGITDQDSLQKIAERLKIIGADLEKVVSDLSAEGSRLRASGQVERARVCEKLVGSLDVYSANVLPSAQRALTSSSNLL